MSAPDSHYDPVCTCRPNCTLHAWRHSIPVKHATSVCTASTADGEVWCAASGGDAGTATDLSVSDEDMPEAPELDVPGQPDEPLEEAADAAPSSSTGRGRGRGRGVRGRYARLGLKTRSMQSCAHMIAAVRQKSRQKSSQMRSPIHMPAAAGHCFECPVLVLRLPHATQGR